ncbi:hypothetical protein Nepgr_017550 [Nepenthes gracilis]|uniref:EF-hand domain-containing protein n=1 Tax=Nepenthes gracilis TaxID=150966 RepID=A0AAD3SRS1_NEPGR|nr:hypothetical protein Nepgr_017550 [Nepenthes gracilis]
MGKDLSDDQVSSMKEAFTLFDTDNDGKIAPSELGILMRSLGGNPTQAQLKEIIAEENLTAPFEFPRFLDLMSKHLKPERFDRQLRDAFKVLDKEGTGYVVVSDLRHILTRSATRISSLGWSLSDNMVTAESLRHCCLSMLLLCSLRNANLSPVLPYLFCHFTLLLHREDEARKANREAAMDDSLDKLIIFLAKRDGIDKLVKTFQYVSKLVHWHTEATRPGLANRAKQWELASGLSRKAFRSGRFLTGFNSLRRKPGSTLTFQLLSVLANAGEMVYFFFDHLLWLSRIGVLDAKLARRMSYISAFGESFGYVFFVVSDFIVMCEGLREEKQLAMVAQTEGAAEVVEGLRKIRQDRVMRVMAVAANVADFIIAVADIEPNPFCNHAVTLGISGLVSAWAGWYRNWPS